MKSVRWLEELINSYDNGLNYNLDNFFRILMGSDGLPNNTIIIYTSDHGQTLSEHGESWPHSGNTRNEACVPVFVISPNQLHVDTTL
ncbi:MAG: sulfatase-like hydrolase/transferase [Planctomycetes bacterium]|nr:sulfatase-like hydrolase/transferase [Planctomycetota bacterium]